MKLGFLGYGNLARALARGVCTRGILPPEDVYICARTEATLSYARSLRHGTCPDAAALFETCDVVVLAIKPKVFREMSYELSHIDTAGKQVISVMAAVKLEELAAVMRCPVMRVMPTLAAADGKDIMGYSTHDDFDNIVPALGKLGKVLALDEDMLERLTVAASCGLGFAAHVLDSYKKQCVSIGFDPEQAEAITRGMFGYAAQNSESFDALESRVATKGGVTEAGNNAMDAQLCAAFGAAFSVAGERVGIKTTK